ncbi:MAG: FHA domain-containing protein [Methylococcaceae bacterium]
MQSYKVIIGRSNDCDLVLADMTVSRHHAEIEMIEGNRLLLTDCQSTHGSFVIIEGSEKKIKQQIITKHDILRFGNIKIPVSEILLATHFPEQVESEPKVLSDQPPSPQNYNQQPNESLQAKNSTLIINSKKLFLGNSISKSKILLNGVELPKTFQFGETQSINIPTGIIDIQVICKQASIMSSRTNILTIESIQNETTVLEYGPNKLNSGFMLEISKGKSIKSKKDSTTLI